MIGYKAEVLASSISPQGIELTTIECTYPRFIHAEMLRHRVFSSSVASSRAIPTEKMIVLAQEHPFIPETFNERVKGMGVGDPLDRSKQLLSRNAWLHARDAAVEQATILNTLGVDKSRVNRLLEPFLFVTHIITATEWDNFFALRCPSGSEVDLSFPAQPEFQRIAIMMRDAIAAFDPDELLEGQWHRPKIDVNVDGGAVSKSFKFESDEEFTDLLNMLSSRRIARVSFDKHTDSEPVKEGIEKAGGLKSLAHFSPFEHVARPLTLEDMTDKSLGEVVAIPCSFIPDVVDPDGVFDPVSETSIVNSFCGNLRGWMQYRKTIVNEDNHRRALEASS